MKEIKKTSYVTPAIKVLELNICSQLMQASGELNGNTGAQVDEPGDGGDINMGKEHDILDEIDWGF